MFTHSKLWNALDQLARTNGYSASGLAKKAGLDPTSFNKSKRKSPEGKPRWPSTESLSKVLAATESTMSDFIELMGENVNKEPAVTVKEVIVEAEPVIIEKNVTSTRDLPLVQDEVASDPQVFDENGFPSAIGQGSFTLPDGQPDLSSQAWALEITSSALAPYYQEGDILIIDPNGPARPGDPFLIRRKSEDKLAVYRGQSANPVIGEPLGRIMGVFYSMAKVNDDQDIAA